MFVHFSFDGYRGFPSRRLRDPSGPLQTLDIAPVTVLLGQNNAGKTSVLALVAQVLHGLGGQQGLPFSIGERSLAGSFLDFLPGGGRLNQMEIAVDLLLRGTAHRFRLVLAPFGDTTAGEDGPWVLAGSWDDVQVEGCPTPLVGSLANGLSIAKEDLDFIRLAAQDSIWIGPYRLPPDPEVPEFPAARAGPLLGPAGEGAVEALRLDPAVFQGVDQWFRSNAGLQLRWEVNLGRARLMSRRVGADAWVGIDKAAAGIHQLLPVVLLAFWRKERGGLPGRLDMVEQPELHLHDALHPALADLMLHLGQAGGRVLVETHSEGLLLRLRRRVAEGRSADDVSISFVEPAGPTSPDGARVLQVRLGADGELDHWPEGVFLETFEELRALRRAQRRRSPLVSEDSP